MHRHTLGIVTLAAAETLTLAAFSEAGFVRQTVHGKLAAPSSDVKTKGLFRLTSRTHDRGAVVDKVEVSCRKLDVTKVDDALPEYHVWLTTSDAGTSADFGALTLHENGRGAFRFNSRNADFPDGVDDVAMFGGGTIEVRNGDTAVLSGSVPEFTTPGGDSGKGTVGVRRDSTRLKPPAGGRARAAIDARHANTPRGTNEQIKIQIVGLRRSGAPYTVVAIAGDATETTLAELTPHGHFGQDREVIDTRDGDEIPGGGGVAGLSEQSVEVRDKDGNVVLSGVFPTISLD